MTAYATTEHFATASAYLDLGAPTDEFGIAALLDRAADDIDCYLDLPVTEAGGDRLDMGALTAGQVEALAVAVAQQAVWRLVVGEEDVVEGKPRVLAAGPVTFASDAPPLVGPEAQRTLSRAGLSRRTGTVTT